MAVFRGLRTRTSLLYLEQAYQNGREETLLQVRLW